MLLLDVAACLPIELFIYIIQPVRTWLPLVLLPVVIWPISSVFEKGRVVEICVGSANAGGSRDVLRPTTPRPPPLRKSESRTMVVAERSLYFFMLHASVTNFVTS